MTIATGERLLASDINNLTFFPKGAVLMYSSAAWSSASVEFKKIWHICDGSTVNGYTTLNLINKFIRGATVSGQTGGTDTTQIPKHSHTFTGNQATGSLNHMVGFAAIPIEQASGVFGSSNLVPNTSVAKGSVARYATHDINFAMTPEGSIGNTGSEIADNKPAYCTVIFIEKVA
ncbi:MAG: hypothetical protein LBL50_02680 [Candidatus Margulisbacteria bacterium]|jgi:hypothetical protein|nr:hypothetical protein [Candidatus Margulisiibacteriota bacterium]